jgi:hypothetical protein
MGMQEIYGSDYHQNLKILKASDIIYTPQGQNMLGNLRLKKEPSFTSIPYNHITAESYATPRAAQGRKIVKP